MGRISSWWTRGRVRFTQQYATIRKKDRVDLDKLADQQNGSGTPVSPEDALCPEDAWARRTSR